MIVASRVLGSQGVSILGPTIGCGRDWIVLINLAVIALSIAFYKGVEEIGLH